MSSFLLRTGVHGESDLAGDGVVFDLDGVLVDSEPCWCVAEQLAVERAGGIWQGVRTDDLAGLAPELAAALLAERCGLVGAETELEREIEDAAVEVFSRDVRPMPGAEAALSRASALAPVGVASNSPRRLALASLRATGLDRWVDVLVTVDDVPEAKPAADPYLVACERLDLAPERSVAIDDTRAGIRSALAAGMIVVAFGNAGLGDLDTLVARIRRWPDAEFLPAPGHHSARLQEDLLTKPTVNRDAPSTEP